MALPIPLWCPPWGEYVCTPYVRCQFPASCLHVVYYKALYNEKTLRCNYFATVSRSYAAAKGTGAVKLTCKRAIGNRQ